MLSNPAPPQTLASVHVKIRSDHGILDAVRSIVRFDLATRISLSAVFGLVCLATFLLALTVREIRHQEEQHALDRVDSNMAVAWQLLHSRGGDLRIDHDRLMAGDTVLNGDTDLVDTVQRLVGGVATIFMNDSRVATNVHTSSGVREVGTVLSAGPVHDAIFKEGKSYRGKADILSESLLHRIPTDPERR